MKPVQLSASGPACVYTRDAAYVVPGNSQDVLDAWKEHTEAEHLDMSDTKAYRLWFRGIPEPVVLLLTIVFGAIIFLPWIVSNVLGWVGSTGPVAVGIGWSSLCWIVGGVGCLYCIIGLVYVNAAYFNREHKSRQLWGKFSTFEDYLQTETPHIHEMMLLPGESRLRVRGASVSTGSLRGDTEGEDDGVEYGEVGEGRVGADGADWETREAEAVESDGARIHTDPLPITGSHRADPAEAEVSESVSPELDEDVDDEDDEAPTVAPVLSPVHGRHRRAN